MSVALSQQRSRCELGPVYVGCEAKKFALGQVLLQELMFPLPVSVYQGSKFVFNFRATVNGRRSGRSPGDLPTKVMLFRKVWNIKKEKYSHPQYSPTVFAQQLVTVYQRWRLIGMLHNKDFFLTNCLGR